MSSHPMSNEFDHVAKKTTLAQTTGNRSGINSATSQRHSYAPCNEDILSANKPLCNSATSKSPSVLDLSLKLRPPALTNDANVSDSLRKQNAKVVHQTLQLLFSNEYLGLIAYTQSIIPVLYMVYIAVLRVLPNRVYYPTTRTVGDAHLFSVISVLAVFQFVSLLVFNKAIAHRFSISTIYQVSFVLKTHAALVQDKLATWLMFTVGFPLDHYGKEN
ncbi:hypothetical protein ON010_g1013 [Phytophthora cinnamomi]|nr:hypothetical protein ON010_g1013 [Phytophthora cinnamomi]